MIQSSQVRTELRVDRKHDLAVLPLGTDARQVLDNVVRTVFPETLSTVRRHAGQHTRTSALAAQHTSRGVLNDDALGNILLRHFRAHKIRLRVRLSILHIVRRNEHGRQVRHPSRAKGLASIVPRGTRHNRPAVVVRLRARVNLCKKLLHTRQAHNGTLGVCSRRRRGSLRVVLVREINDAGLETLGLRLRLLRCKLRNTLSQIFISALAVRVMKLYISDIKRIRTRSSKSRLY